MTEEAAPSFLSKARLDTEPTLQTRPVEVLDQTTVLTARESKRRKSLLHKQLFKAGELFFREKEQEILKQSLEQVQDRLCSCPEVLLVSGDVGSGKSTLVSSLNASECCVLTVKCQRIGNTDGQTIFQHLVADCCRKIIARDQVESVREALMSKVPTEIKVLAGMVPDLGVILDLGDDTDKPTQSERQVAKGRLNATVFEQFKFLLRQFFQAVGEVSPIVIVVDDLNFADQATMDLLLTLVLDPNNKASLFLCLYRREKAEWTDTFPLLLHELQQIANDEIQIQNLSSTQVSNLVSTVFKTDSRKSDTLGDLIWKHTQGNMFFVIEYIRSLVFDDWIQFDFGDGRWVWDMEEIQLESASVVELVQTRFSRLPEATQRFLQNMSCLGPQGADMETLSVIDEAAKAQLDLAARVFLVDSNTQDHWHFTHETVRVAVYSTISESDRPGFHHRLGRRIWKEVQMDQFDDRVGEIVGQLMQGTSEMKEARERIAVVKLCLHAGQQAVAVSNFSTAHSYLIGGTKLLETTDAWRTEYDLCLEIHNAAAEVAYVGGHVASARVLADTIIEHSKHLEDSIGAYSVKIYSQGSSGEPKEAMLLARSVLIQLGEKLPKPDRSSRRHVLMTYLGLQRRLAGKSNEMILRMAPMTDKSKLAAMQILNLCSLYALAEKPEMMILCGLKMASMTLEFGLNTLSCIGFVFYAGALCAFGRVEAGFRYGELAFALLRKFNADPWLARISVLYFETVAPWKVKIQDSVGPLHTASSIGFQSGDIEFAMFCETMSWICQVEIVPLPESNTRVRRLAERLELHKQTFNLTVLKAKWQSVQNLMGLGHGSVTELTGEVMDDSERESFRDIGVTLYIASCYPKQLLCFLFGYYEEAERQGKHCRSLIEAPLNPVFSAYIMLVEALTLVEVSRLRNKLKRSDRRRILWYSRRFKKWSVHAPYTFLCRHRLIEASYSSLQRNDARAYPQFVEAIALAKEGGFLLMAGMANELTAKHLLRKDRTSEAVVYVQEALAYYKKWGAVAKVRHLTEEYRHVLSKQR